MSSADQDGAQLAARVLLGGMKLPSPGLRVDPTGQIVSLALSQGCRVSPIEEQAVAPGLSEKGRSMFRGLSSDITVELV